uniref:L115 n=1 Tax=Mus musculus TaxID=10090 RepID=Q924A3_MOUSE|nr:L115 [Mus musculus]
MLRTHSSSFVMSVSSSQGFTSSRMEDFATTAGFLAFLDSYCARRSSRSFFASSLSSSSSDPKRSMSSSSLASAPARAAGRAARAGTFQGAPPSALHQPGLGPPPE